MILGWSAGGHNDLRATDDDRESVLRLLDMAYGEGRLDSVEHARRADAIHASKTRKDLAALTTDLPNQRGVREWIDDARIRADDRDRAVGWLAEAAALGRLTTARYQERISALSEVATYTQLKRVLDGVHGVNLLAGTADREAALASLTEAAARDAGQRRQPGAGERLRGRVLRAVPRYAGSADARAGGALPDLRRRKRHRPDRPRLWLGA